MAEFGVVLVSHSNEIAQGLYKLIQEVAKDVPITVAGGTDDNEIGTSFDKILEAVNENVGKEILAFFDLGSAKMNLEMTQEMADKKITMYNVPLIEGAYTASALLQTKVGIEEIENQLEPMKMDDD